MEWRAVNEERGLIEIPEDLLGSVVKCLTEPGRPILGALEFVPPVPGLYAIGADAEIWASLGLKAMDPGVPLYVGKSESSLVGRDLGDHFGVDPENVPNTGSSTVRRSFAALLRETLEFQAVPRNKKSPERPANYGLEDGGDLRLTSWMQVHLTLAWWPKPSGLSYPLESIEKKIIKKLDPPINILHARTERKALKGARAAMAAEARAWMEENAR